MPGVWHWFCLNAGGSGIGNARGSALIQKMEYCITSSLWPGAGSAGASVPV